MELYVGRSIRATEAPKILHCCKSGELEGIFSSVNVFDVIWGISLALLKSQLFSTVRCSIPHPTRRSIHLYNHLLHYGATSVCDVFIIMFDTACKGVYPVLSFDLFLSQTEMKPQRKVSSEGQVSGHIFADDKHLSQKY